MNLLTKIDKKKDNNLSYSPTFFKLKNKADSASLEELLTKENKIKVYDALLGQVEELVKSINPKIKFTKSSLTEAAKKHIGNTPYEEYGVWVYYPWSNRLVHILDEAEFIEVRTNRNQYKITKEEREVLATKKIGVMGLSVGQSIALTMAMERSFGELRLADFDILELSNLNRIRTGLHNLNIPKPIIVAREIAEIDPYLKVICYNEGITEENIDKFITEGGKLDILVDECDGLYIKILSRQRAKHFNIPVVMDTSDRGMIDVERFDLEPNRSIFHGLIDHLDISKVKEAKTNEEKVPYLLPMLGMETVSKRMKASMLEIEQTVTTWPQLATSVALGGGVAGDVCRRILLNQFHDSGRYFIDTEELISNKNKELIKEKKLSLNPSISEEEMKIIVKQYGFKNYDNQFDLTKAQLNELVTAATQAPSGANSQSWKWLYQNKTLFLFLDGIYNAALLDTGNTTSLVGLGAASENLVLKAHEMGLEVITEIPELNFESKLVAIFKFFSEPNDKIKNKLEPHICDELVKVIPQRLTNRNITERQILNEAFYKNLTKIAESIRGAQLLLVHDEKTLMQLAEVIAKMDRIRIMHEGGQQDFRAEIRWTKEEVEIAKNGIDLLGTVDLTPSELAGFQMVKEWEVVKYLNDWNGGTGLEKIGRKSVLGSSALGLLVMPKFSSNDFFMGGRALERVWLTANKENVAVHPASISTLIFNTLKYGNKNILSGKIRDEVIELRKEFEKLFAIKQNYGEVLLLRFFKAGPPKSRSVRYPIDQILKIVLN